MKNLVVAILISFIFFQCALPAQSQEKLEPAKSFFDLIHSDEIPEFIITANYDSIIDLKNTATKFAATLIIKEKDKNKEAFVWNADLSVRGKFRRRTCDFPPLKLQISKKQLLANGFTKHNDLKLVTHCLDGDIGKENVLRENLVYQLYNTLSPYSFRTQVVKITYKSSNSKKKFTRFGVIIEDEDEMAERLNGELCEDCFNVPIDSFDIDNVKLHSLFQFMIANTDWSVVLNRNLKQLILQESGKYVIIPYDFDFSGFVNAIYAIPNSNLDLTSLRHRVFMGEFGDSNDFSILTAHFNNQKAVIKNKIKKYKYLSGASKIDLINYIDSFYDIINERDFTKGEIFDYKP